MIGITGIIVLILLMFCIELPVGFAMAIVGLAGLWYVLTPEAALALIGTEVWSTFSKYGLSVIPLFIFMGQVCFYSGVNKNLYNTAYKWMGRTRGGLAMATIMACAGFSAICGSNTATAATMTAVALPEMKKYNYKAALSSASIACGSTLGVVIPPSVVLIVYGIYTEQSIGKLFWGSAIPGLFITVLFCLTVYIICLVRPEMGPGGPRTSIMEKIKAIPGAFEMMVLFTLVMAGLYSGAYTPTEAGAAGAFFAVVLGLIRRKLSWQGFVASIVDTLKVACMIIMIVAGAVIFGRFLTISRLPFEIADFVAALPVQPLGDHGLHSVHLCCGRLGDGRPGILAGFNSYFLSGSYPNGVRSRLVRCNLDRGYYHGGHYPTSWNQRVRRGGMDRDIPLGTVFKGVVWFLPAYLIAAAALLLYPQVVLFLPTYVR